VRSADNRNLVATFTVRAQDPDRVVVVSELCDDERLGRLLDEHAAPLAEAGFSSLACTVDGGTVVFARSLR
jgi:hypothetical protein